jgi:hypothetical protein
MSLTLKRERGAVLLEGRRVALAISLFTVVAGGAAVFQRRGAIAYGRDERAITLKRVGRRRHHACVQRHFVSPLAEMKPSTEFG